MEYVNFLFVFTFFVTNNGQPRTFVYPPGFGNKVQFIVGIGVPASNLPTVQSVTWGYVIKTNYILPTNVSHYGDGKKFEKRSASVSRWDFYRTIADVLNRSGLEGEECIKRTICEASKIKFAKYDVIGELLNILLLPSSTRDTDTEYYRAEVYGLSSKIKCSKMFNKCPINLLNLFSVTGKHPHFSSILAMRRKK